MSGEQYAKIFFKLVGMGETEEMTQADKVLRKHPEYAFLLDCGCLSVKKAQELIALAFGDTMTAAVLKMMASGRQVFLWNDFVSAVEKRTDAERCVTCAEVVTAAPLSETLQNRMTHILENKLGKKVRLCMREDKTVLGGMSIEADGLYWDGTVVGYLRRMKETMKGEER